jgi:hypothetical protein
MKIKTGALDMRIRLLKGIEGCKSGIEGCKTSHKMGGAACKSGIEESKFEECGY